MFSIIFRALFTGVLKLRITSTDYFTKSREISRPLSSAFLYERLLFMTFLIFSALFEASISAVPDQFAHLAESVNHVSDIQMQHAFILKAVMDKDKVPRTLGGRGKDQCQHAQSIRCHWWPLFPAWTRNARSTC